MRRSEQRALHRQHIPLHRERLSRFLQSSLLRTARRLDVETRPYSGRRWTRSSTVKGCLKVHMTLYISDALWPWEKRMFCCLDPQRQGFWILQPRRNLGAEIPCMQHLGWAVRTL